MTNFPHHNDLWSRHETCQFIVLLCTPLPELWETWVRSLGWEDLLEKGKDTHSSILAWRIPWTTAGQLDMTEFSRSVMSNSLRPHEPQHARPPCPSPTPGVYPNSCPLSRWCHPTISSSVIPISFCLQSFPASGSFQMSQLFASGGQNTGVSASTSVLPMNTQDWFPLVKYTKMKNNVDYNLVTFSFMIQRLLGYLCTYSTVEIVQF